MSSIIGMGGSPGPDALEVGGRLGLDLGPVASSHIADPVAEPAISSVEW